MFEAKWLHSQTLQGDWEIDNFGIRIFLTPFSIWGEIRKTDCNRNDSLPCLGLASVSSSFLSSDPVTQLGTDIQNAASGNDYPHVEEWGVGTRPIFRYGQLRTRFHSGAL